MRPTVSQYAQALVELSETADVKVLVGNLFGFLKRRGETEKAVSILERLEYLAALKEKRVGVTTVTAHEPTAETKRLLMKKAEMLFPGKQVELSYEIDESVIGGVRFRSEELSYDATVASELSSLKKTISK